MKKAPDARFPRFERVAHRGSPKEQPENTLAGFLLALERGADAVELDAHVTKDRVVVVHHDDVVQRRAIAQTKWRELSKIDLGAGARIPRLQDVLEAIAERATVYVELKGQAIEKEAVEVVRKFGGRFALHSFDHDAIERVGRMAPDIPRGVLLDRDTPRPMDALRQVIERIRPRDVWPHWSLANEQFVRLAHELGTRVIVWTVNSPGTAGIFVSLGVDGVCTDDVSLLANL
jgi:glycerophosphoryl diester phosphodiesterase